MALKSGGEDAAARVKMMQTEIQRRRQYLNKTKSSFEIIENDLKAIAFDGGFLSSMLLYATVLNYDGNIQEFLDMTRDPRAAAFWKAAEINLASKAPCLFSCKTARKH